MNALKTKVAEIALIEAQSAIWSAEKKNRVAKRSEMRQRMY